MHSRIILIIPNRTKIRLIRSLIFSISGAETWTLKVNDRKRLDAFKMVALQRDVSNPLDSAKHECVNTHGRIHWSDQVPTTFHGKIHEAIQVADLHSAKWSKKKYTFRPQPSAKRRRTCKYCLNIQFNK